MRERQKRLRRCLFVNPYVGRDLVWCSLALTLTAVYGNQVEGLGKEPYEWQHDAHTPILLPNWRQFEWVSALKRGL